MKKLLKIMSLVLVLVLAIGVMVACNDTTPPADVPGNTDDPGTTPPVDDPGTTPPADDGNGEDATDIGVKYTVTFKYVDPQGNEIKDKDGYGEKDHKNIKWDGDARNTNIDDVQAFADYVIIGWNADLEAAKAGTVDPKATANVKGNRTLYSVVRAKAEVKVVLQNSVGEKIGEVNVKEGEALPAVDYPREVGKYFKGWEKVGTTTSELDCIREACTFKATAGVTDGIVGKVAAGSIVIDAKKDAAYTTSGAVLPVNMKRNADGAKMVDNAGSRAIPTSKTDVAVVWDGDYVYMLIEVYDKTLLQRADAYVKGGIDAWLNDSVELWYTFEQNASLAKNETRIGLDCMGKGTYALGRDKGIGGGRSTHYEEIEYATRDAFHHTGTDLSTPAALGITAPSYIIEYKIPAKTEGAADVAKYPDLTGSDLESFKKTGLIPGKTMSNDINDFAFTDGQKLVAGDFIRLNLQVNDLMFTQDQIEGKTNEMIDSPDEARLIADLGADYKKQSTGLYALDVVTGKLTGAAYPYTAKFAAAGSTQRDVKYYIMLSLGDTAKAENNFVELGVNASFNTIFIGKDGNEYVRQ